MAVLECQYKGSYDRLNNLVNNYNLGGVNLSKLEYEGQIFEECLLCLGIVKISTPVENNFQIVFTSPSECKENLPPPDESDMVENPW